MLVLRVEDLEGNGYKYRLDTNIANWTKMGVFGELIKTSDEEKYFSRRPLPENDGINLNMLTENHLFGFSDMDQLNDWFLPADLVMGTLLGGKLVFYEVDVAHILFGDSQVAFDKTKSTQVGAKLDMDFYLPSQQKLLSNYDFIEEVKEAIEMGFPVPEQLNFLIGKESDAN